MTSNYKTQTDITTLTVILSCIINGFQPAYDNKIYMYKYSLTCQLCFNIFMSPLLQDRTVISCEDGIAKMLTTTIFVTFVVASIFLLV